MKKNHVYKDKNNNYFVKINIHGITYFKRFKKNKAAAVKYENYLKATALTLNKYTIEDLFNIYLENLKEKVKITSYYSTKLIVDKHIRPYFNLNVKVEELTQLDFNNFRNKIAKLKYRSKNKILRRLVLICEFGEDYLDLKIPYAKRLNKFRNDYAVINEKTFNVDLDLIKAYCDYSNSYIKLFLILSFVFGLRISECRCITVDSIVDNHLYIYKQITSKTGCGRVILSTKSKSSNRVYLLSSSLKMLICEHIKENHLNNNDYLFFSFTKGKNYAVGETSIRRYLKDIEVKYHLKHLKPHDLRHLEISYLYSNNIKLETISKYVGHKNTVITNEIYLHLLDENQKQINHVIDMTVDELIKK